jgi:hypothetical protein
MTEYGHRRGVHRSGGVIDIGGERACQTGGRSTPEFNAFIEVLPEMHKKQDAPVRNTQFRRIPDVVHDRSLPLHALWPASLPFQRGGGAAKKEILVAGASSGC